MGLLIDAIAVSGDGSLRPVLLDDVVDTFAKVPFAGGRELTLFLLFRFSTAHIRSGRAFSDLTMYESNELRLICKEFREAVMDFPWMDASWVSHVKGSLRAWRAAFPAARVVNVKGVWRQKPIVDSDFVHIRGDARARLHTVDMSDCTSVRDAAFVHLRGIHTLAVGGCDHGTITDAAFVHLHGIQKLDMSCCWQATITDAAFVHLRGIHPLYMDGCNQLTITDAAFEQLRGM